MLSRGPLHPISAAEVAGAWRGPGGALAMLAAAALLVACGSSAKGDTGTTGPLLPPQPIAARSAAQRSCRFPSKTNAG